MGTNEHKNMHTDRPEDNIDWIREKANRNIWDNGYKEGRKEREAEIIEIINRFLQEDGIDLIKQIKEQKWK